MKGRDSRIVSKASIAARLWLYVVLALAGVAGLAGCSAHELRPRDDLTIPCASAACSEPLEIRYIGTSAFLIRYGEHAVLTGGLVSNPCFCRIAIPFAKVRPDSARIHQLYHGLPGIEHVRAILIGHSHYDHLMEVPHISRLHVPRSALILGDSTMQRLIAPLQDRLRVHPIPIDSAGTIDSTGHWYHVTAAARADAPGEVVRADTPGGDARAGADTGAGRVRIMALLSEHAPNVKLGELAFTIADERQHTERGRLPSTAHGWKKGAVYAYLIDFLAKDGTVAYRVHYQDAASTPPLGFVPTELALDRRVDVMIVTAGNYQNVPDYPRRLVGQLQPRHVLIGHWENFFLPYSTAPIGIPLQPDGGLIRRITSMLPPDATWSTPNPGTVTRIFSPR